MKWQLVGYFPLAILSPRVVAFLAPKELGRGLVSAARLEEPPESHVVPALWAFYVSRRHCLDFFLLVPNYFEVTTGILRLHNVRCRGDRRSRTRALLESAFLADEMRARFFGSQLEAGTAFRTELHVSVYSGNLVCTSLPSLLSR